jgi:hypothetical protein
MDFIRPIHPDRDVDPLWRVERMKDEPERREQKQEQQKDARGKGQDAAAPEGPVEGDDGHLHIDIKA